MGQTKIYPSTQAQVQAVQTTVDEINAKIVTPTYQAKIVTPTTAQQLIEPDNGYDALSSVTVNPSQTTDLDNWISRNDQQEPIYLELTTDKIADYACYGQSRLVSFKGDNVTTISTSAFQNCASLQNIDTRNVTSIGNSAFQNCTSLQNIDTRNVTSIGSSAFYGCTSLTTINLPASLSSIVSYAFYGCTSLTTINLPASLSSIVSSAFQSCTSLENVSIADGFNCNNLNLAASTRYSVETIVSWLEALADRTGQFSFTLTIGATNLNKLTAEQKAIATNKNWTLA